MRGPARKRSPTGNQDGFSLLEAVVSLALLAAVLVPLYALVGQALDAAVRIADSDRRSEIERNMLEVMQTINPMAQPQGMIPLGPYAVRWTSRPVEPPRPNVAPADGPAGFEIALFDCHVEAVAPDGRSLAAFDLRRVGFRRLDAGD